MNTERLLIVDAFAATEDPDQRQAILTRHRVTETEIESWSRALYGKPIRGLYQAAWEPIPGLRLQRGRRAARVDQEHHIEVLRRLVAYAWRRGVYDEMIAAATEDGFDEMIAAATAAAEPVPARPKRRR